MRGIRLIKELCKDFGLSYIEQKDNSIFFSLKNYSIKLYFNKSYILIITIPYKEPWLGRFKYSEKYKIKQIIHEALSD